MNIYKNKVAVVTGAGSGIGKALSEKLAGMGAKVTASDIDARRVEETVAGIRAAGGQARGEPLDVTDPGAFREHLERTFSGQGQIDYLFNNAGVVVFSEMRDLDVEHWRKVIDVNLNGVFHGSLAAYKLMVRQGVGHIVNLSSIEGLLPFPGSAPYVASKYAVLGFTQTLWVEGGHFGVRASAVCPGFVRTRIFEDADWVRVNREKAMARGNIFEKFSASPEKCAEVILKGVARNKPIILVTGPAHFMWRLARLSPVGVMKAVKKDFDRWRESVRTEHLAAAEQPGVKS